MATLQRRAAPVVVAAVAAALLSACATPQSGPRRTILQHTFDPDAGRFIEAVGANVVSGEAFLRTVGGDVKTCAGLPVYLYPATEYSSERMAYIYGVGASGFRPLRGVPPVAFDPDPPEYSRLRRTTICSAAGEFTFPEVADGDYFVVANVQWGTGAAGLAADQGGYLMRRIAVRAGQHLKLTISQT